MDSGRYVIQFSLYATRLGLYTMYGLHVRLYVYVQIKHLFGLPSQSRLTRNMHLFTTVMTENYPMQRAVRVVALSAWYSCILLGYFKWSSYSTVSTKKGLIVFSL